MATPHDILVRNEQAKLTATYLNGIAIALAAIGGIAPWVAAAQKIEVTPSIALLTIGCVVVSVALHLAARTLLRGMVV